MFSTEFSILVNYIETPFFYFAIFEFLQLLLYRIITPIIHKNHEIHIITDIVVNDY